MSMRLPLALAAFVLLLAACGDGEAEVSAGDSLTGRTFLSQWVTESGEGHRLVDGTQIRLQFHDDGRLTASAGCNTIGGTVRIDGDRLVVDELSTTEMGCDPPRHEQDEWLAALLESGPTYELDGNTLRLTSMATKVDLTDREVADPDRPLEATQWVLDSIVEGDAVGSVPQDGGATVRFVDGQVNVRITGCNQGSAPYEAAGGDLTFGPLTMTKMACQEPAATMEQTVTAVLEGTVGYEIEADVLRLTHPSGQGLGFRG